MGFSQVPSKRLRWICTKQVWQLLAIIFVGSLLSVPSFAQSNLGRVYGAVSDQSGGAVVGAAVSVIDIARGITRPLVADSAGQYDASSLIRAPTRCASRAKGFQVTEHTDVEVGVGKEVRVDLTLQPGEQTTTVTVTGELPLINTSNAELGGTLENLTVNELPVERPQLPIPGLYAAGRRDGPDRRAAGLLHRRHECLTTILWLIDGVSDSNLFVGGPSLVGGAETPSAGLDEQTILPVDAIQEVNMIENPTAEYGDKSGMHVDVGLKSGTNTFHGAGTAFGRDNYSECQRILFC